MDLFPTFAELANAQPEAMSLDGISLNDLLFGNTQLPQRTLYWKMDDEFAVRRGPWKLIKTEGRETELFNLEEDLAESNDRASTNPEMKQQLLNSYGVWVGEMKRSASQWKLTGTE